MFAEGNCCHVASAPLRRLGAQGGGEGRRHIVSPRAQLVVINDIVVVVVVVEYLYSASRSASNALIVPQRCEEMSL